MIETQEALAKSITALWEGRDDLFAVLPEGDARAAILQAVELLDTGEARVAEVVNDEVVVHEERVRHGRVDFSRRAHTCVRPIA